MAKRVSDKIKLTSIDELLWVPAGGGTEEIEIGLIQPFKNHPFHVVDDEKMDDLVDSIINQGILTPVLIRP
ncbi:MAG: ParB N-terminal domain-containing protein, partial [Lachnospiraceae bacterium]|nr:ParB N-terminal domain-containing protein [Lachnospiraceae bacterium]